ncbi:MAG: exopolysaccharide biosynthesis protein [Clostridium butyricum]|nr:exopolysaccharide biosynthesis protein [Clostridium butyricum]
MSADRKNVKRKENKKIKKVKKKKKKSSFLTIIYFLVFEAVFTACTFPFILLYGPFDQAKKVWVGAAMSTMSHQWLATAFLSDEKISEIQGIVTKVDEVTNVDDIQIPTVKDDTIDAKTFRSDNGKYEGYYLIVKDPTRIKVGYSSKLRIEGETTSQIAQNNNAIAAINGGAFTDSSSSAQWTGNGGFPSGLIMSGEEIIHSDIGGDTGKTDLLAFTKEGKMIVGNYNIQQLREMDVQEALSFTPVLISNGKKVPIGVEWGIAPRTAIGQRLDGAVILLVIDGRSIVGSKGASLTELQEVMYKLGAYNAINLDGGKSTTMYYNGKVINNPSNSMGERPIPSAIIVK